MTSQQGRINVVASAIWDGVDSVLIAQRSSKDSYPGVWEFVGGKQENGETLEEALHRELDEELGVKVQVLLYLGFFDFNNKFNKFRLHVYLSRWLSGVPQAHEHDDLAWLRLLDVRERNWASPDVPFLEPVQKELQFLLDRLH